MKVTPGSPDVTTYFSLRLAADGTAATALTISELDLQYVRSGVAPVAKVDAVALAATDTAHTDNRAIEVDATDQPGVYRVDWPDAAFLAGVREVILSVKHTTCFPADLRVELETIQTGDGFARLGAPAGASVSADVAAVKAETAAIVADTNELQTDWVNGGRLDLLLDATLADTNELQTDWANGGRLDNILDARASQTSVDTIDGIVDSILIYTAEIGAAGAGLTGVPWNAAWDAQVESEVNDALVVHRLDELLNADSDIDGAAPPTVGSVFHELMTKTAGSFTYDQTTDSLEAIRDRGDAAWTGGAGLTVQEIVDGVWDEAYVTHNGPGSFGDLFGQLGTNVTDILADTGTAGVVVAAASKTGYALAASGLDSISTTAPTGVASNFREMLVATWRWFYKRSTLTSTQLKTYADNGTSVISTASVSDDGTTQDKGAAS